MKPVTTVAVALFGLIALLQLARFLMGWEITVNGMMVPVWASGIAFLVAGAVAFMLWRENGHMIT